MIVPNSLTPEEIFRFIKNGDCAIFQFQEWLEDKVTYRYLEHISMNDAEQDTGQPIRKMLPRKFPEDE